MSEIYEAMLCPDENIRQLAAAVALKGAVLRSVNLNAQHFHWLMCARAGAPLIVCEVVEGKPRVRVLTAFGYVQVVCVPSLGDYEWTWSADFVSPTESKL